MDDDLLTRPQEVTVDFPAVLVLEHQELSSAGMFQLAAALDAYELRADAGERGRRIKDTFVIDVLEMAPTQVTIRITPQRRVPYIELASKIDLMLRDVTTGVLPGKMRMSRLTWEIRESGVSTDERQRRGRIR